MAPRDRHDDMSSWLGRHRWFTGAVAYVVVRIVSLSVATALNRLAQPAATPERPATTVLRVRAQSEGGPPSGKRKPSSAERRRAERAEIGDDIRFATGFFFEVMPFVGLIVGILAAAIGIVSLLEALASIAFTGLLIGLGHPRLRASGVIDLVFDVVVEPIAKLAVALAAVPVAGRVAEVVGMTIVLWLPVAVLAVVALVTPG
jgi:hypothetical protein